MSLSIEILPRAELKDNWKEKIIQKITDIFISDVNDDEYFRVFIGEINLFDFWKSNKSLCSGFFTDEDYIDGLKNLDKIDVKMFLNNFKDIPYTIILESKPTRKENELQYMILFTKVISEITKGIILFDQSFLGYKSNVVYLPDDLMP